MINFGESHESAAASVLPEHERGTNSIEQTEEEKINNDPTRKFLKEQGFEGEPHVAYSIDVIVGKSQDGDHLQSRKTFSNYEDLQDFIKNNPEAVAQKPFVEEAGVMPYRVDYDSAVYAWSENLSPEDSARLDEANDRFTAEMMDVRNFEKTQQETERGGEIEDVQHIENKVLSHLNNPELNQIVGSKNEVSELVYKMGSDIRYYDELGKEALVKMTREDLQNLNKSLERDDSEGLLEVDQILANYLNRELSQKVQELLNRTDIAIPWKEKERVLQIAQNVERIRSRADISKTRDIMAQEKFLNEIIKKYTQKRSLQGKKKDRLENDLEKVKSDEDAEEQLPQDKEGLVRYAKKNFGNLRDITLEQFEQNFTPEVMQEYQVWVKSYVNALIKDKPSGTMYLDTVASVLSNLPIELQSIISLKEGRSVSYDEFLSKPFSDVAKKYLDMDVPGNYFSHFRKR